MEVQQHLLYQVRLTSVHLLAIKKNGLKLQPVDDFQFQVVTLTIYVFKYLAHLLLLKLTNTVDFEEDTDVVEGGSSEGSYVTKTVNLENYINWFRY